MLSSVDCLNLRSSVVQTIEAKVDAALIEQLRAGYGQLASKGAPLALQEGAAECHPPPARGYVCKEEVQTHPDSPTPQWCKTVEAKIDASLIEQLRAGYDLYMAAKKWNMAAAVASHLVKG